MSDAELHHDLLEAVRCVTSAERAIAEGALADLYERLGANDKDVAAVDAVVSGWHRRLLAFCDGASEGLRPRLGAEVGQSEPPGKS